MYEEVIVCEVCEGAGTNSSWIIDDYHKNEGHDEHKVCGRCEGSGRLLRTVTYAPYKQPQLK